MFLLTALSSLLIFVRPGCGWSILPTPTDFGRGLAIALTSEMTACQLQAQALKGSLRFYFLVSLPSP